MFVGVAVCACTCARELMPVCWYSCMKYMDAFRLRVINAPPLLKQHHATILLPYLCMQDFYEESPEVFAMDDKEVRGCVV